MNLIKCDRKCDRCSNLFEEEATIIDISTGACLCHKCAYDEKCEALQKSVSRTQCDTLTFYFGHCRDCSLL